MKCFVEIDKMIYDGRPFSEMIKVIRANNDYEGVADGTIEAAVSLYRSKLPVGRIAAERMPQVFLKKVREFKDGVDSLKEMQVLYFTQLERIDNFIKKEEMLKFL